MESSNFTLDKEIKNYVDLINAQGSLNESDKKELISHLLDSTELLVGLGLNEEESFLIACKRIGKTDVLATEYGKVNFSLRASKIWVYLFTGFNLFYSLPSLVILLLSILYYSINSVYSNSLTAVTIITFVNLLLSAAICCIAIYKHQISSFLENQVEKKPFRLILITSLPLAIKYFSLKIAPPAAADISLWFQIRELQSSIAEFSLILVPISIIAVFIMIIFSLGKVTHSTLESVFGRPSALFLVLFGTLTELFSASTRVLRADNIIYSSIMFGFVYMSASYLITVQNRTSSLNKNLAIAFSFGVFAEVSVGISADIDRGGSYFTLFFTAALILGVLLGRSLGISSSKRKGTKATN
ncbi:hypothetical protein [Pedobacter sp. BMA]|uniref:hypothetical protein n=1 Tax=Pedobacter sp. BMA TaxID=1663685 RepID=UPI000649A222|nr:hypothetical protein [Pedobacter sp. BMA]KLT65398.1 hypothetical protein AB669_09925 [Pedobacter sp. BMA]